jgi:7TM diverse intracellular signalling
MISTTLHFLFLGIAFFQTLFIFIQWIFFRREEYLLYIAYINAIIFFILFRINDALPDPFVSLPVWLKRLTYQPLGIFSYWMYLCFARSFLNLKNSQPDVNNYIRRLEYVMVGFMIGCIVLIPFNISTEHLAVIYFIGYILMLLFSIPAFVLMLRQKDLLNNFLVIGCLLYVAGGFTGMLFNYFLNKFSSNNLNVFFGVEIGILLELLLLNTGFLLKNRILQQQVLKGQSKILNDQKTE